MANQNGQNTLDFLVSLKRSLKYVFKINAYLCFFFFSIYIFCDFMLFDFSKEIPLLMTAAFFINGNFLHLYLCKICLDA